MATPAKRLDLVDIARLDFSEPDVERFPALRLARGALEAGGSAPAVLNAANEVAVAGFLRSGMPFGWIADVIDSALQAWEPAPADSIENVMDADRRARDTAGAALRSIC